MEKHIPANGDLPPMFEDVLVKHVDGDCFIGYYVQYSGGYWKFYEIQDDTKIPTQEIECWWYLPE